MLVSAAKYWLERCAIGRLVDLLAADGVGILHDVDLLGGDIADDADGQARAGERLAGDKVLRQAQLTAEPDGPRP